MTKGLVYTTWPRGKIVLQILSIPVFFFLVTCAHSGLFYLACSPHLTRSIRKDVSREVCKCVCCFSGGMAAQGELQTHSVRGTSVSLFICGFVWVWETEGKGEREEERETCLSLQEINSIHWKKKTSQFFSVIRRKLSLYFCSNHLHGAQENATRSVHRNSIRGQTRISPHLHSNYY